MKKVIASFAFLATIGLMSCNSQSKSSSEDVNNESLEVQSEQQEQQQKEQEEAETQPSIYCQTCGSEISGSPYEAFGRIYCDMQCYADDPTN